MAVGPVFFFCFRIPICLQVFSSKKTKNRTSTSIFEKSENFLWGPYFSKIVVFHGPKSVSVIIKLQNVVKVFFVVQGTFSQIFVP